MANLENHDIAEMTIKGLADSIIMYAGRPAVPIFSKQTISYLNRIPQNIRSSLLQIPAIAYSFHEASATRRYATYDSPGVQQMLTEILPVPTVTISKSDLTRSFLIRFYTSRYNRGKPNTPSMEMYMPWESGHSHVVRPSYYGQVDVIAWDEFFREFRPDVKYAAQCLAKTSAYLESTPNTNFAK